MRRLVALLVAALVVPVSAQAATNPVVAAAKRTATVKSSKLQLNVKTTIPGRATMTLTGDGAHSGTSVELTMRTRAVGAPVTIDAIMLNERGASVMYMRSPSFQQQLPSGKSWLRVDLSKQAASLALDFSSLLNTSSFAPLEKGLVSTTRLGRETVAGASTTHYRAVIDIRRAARAVPAYGKQVAALEKATGVRLDQELLERLDRRRRADPPDAVLDPGGRRRRPRHDRTVHHVPRLRRAGLDQRAAAGAGLRDAVALALARRDLRGCGGLPGASGPECAARGRPERARPPLDGRRDARGTRRHARAMPSSSDLRVVFQELASLREVGDVVGYLAQQRRRERHLGARRRARRRSARRSGRACCPRRTRG